MDRSVEAHRHNPPPVPAVLAIAAGIASMLVGCGLVAAYGVALITGGQPGAVQTATMSGALALEAWLFGTGLVLAGLGPRQRPSWLASPFGARGPGPWLAAFVLILGAGWTLASVGGPAAIVALPTVHLAAALAPALAIMALVVQRSGGQPRIDVWSGLAYGGCLAALLALLVEGLLVGLALLALFQAEAQQGGADLVAALGEALEASAAGDAVDLSAVSELLLRPAVLVAVVGVLGLAGPMTEELAKLGGVAGRSPRRRYRAWFWGVAAGAGFGVTEALTLGAVAVDSGFAWVGTVLVRITALIMHATMAGLAGVGWHTAVVEGRRLKGLAMVGVAVAGHALWNTLVLGVVLSLVRSAQGAGAAGPGAGAVGPWAVLAQAATLGIIALFTAVFLALWRASRQLVLEPPMTPD